MDQELISILKRAKRLARTICTSTGILRMPEGIRGASINMLRVDQRLWAAYTRGKNDQAAETRRFLTTRRARPPATAARSTQSRPSTSPRSAGMKFNAPSAAPGGRASQQPALSQVTTLNRSNQSARMVRPASGGALNRRKAPAVPRPPSLPPYQYRPRMSPPARPSNNPWLAPVAGTSTGITAGKPRKTTGKIRNDHGRPAECQRNKIQYVRPMAKAQRAGPSQERGMTSPDQSGCTCADLQEQAEAMEVETLRADHFPWEGLPVETVNSAGTGDSVTEDDILVLENSGPALPMQDEVLEDLPSFFSCSPSSSRRGD